MKKNYFKVILLVSVLIIAILGLVACGEKDETPTSPETLKTPVLFINENVVYWDADSDAEKFELSIDGVITQVENTITSKELSDGQTLKVRAIGDGVSFTTSDWSKAVTYEAPVEPEDPETPVDPEDPETPVEPEDPETPVEPEDPETPVEPEDPETPVEPEDPETPVEPEDPETPVDPEDPETPVEPEDPETPVEPEDPETPVEPEDPETPVDPEEPETPVEPEEPETPVEPEEPETPVEPEDPETPVDPEDPETPVEPEDPDTPVAPEEPEDDEITIGELNSNFDFYIENEVTVTGFAYMCDESGIFLMDEEGDNIYVYTSYSNLYIGQTLTLTGKTYMYYSLPQFKATNIVYGAQNPGFENVVEAKSIQEIILENERQASAVYDHNVYRTTGTITQDGNYYYIVDGDYKLEWKSTIFDNDFNVVKSYVGKKVGINIVVGDCFSTTGIFRVLPLREEKANIVEITEEEPEVPEEPEEPVVPEEPEEPVVPEEITTIAGALSGEIGATASFTGTVSGIYYAWNEEYNNMSFYVSDGADEILVFRAGTKVEIGDKVFITGQIGSYNNVNQIAQGAIVNIMDDPDVPSNYTDVNFVMINDTHGAFVDSAEGYSIGRVDTLIQNITQSKGNQIFIHNGDAFQGSYVSGQTKGLALIEALNAMQLDCFVIGNHEFDWGIDQIAKYADGDPSNGEANFPFLGANIFYAGTQTRPDWIKAYHIVEQDGVKVGIIGIIGDEQESSILTSLVSDYEFSNSLNVVRDTAIYLRNTEDCDVVVLATHDYNESFNASVASFTGASMVDAIFCAHTHWYINEYETRNDGNSIPVVQCLHKNNMLMEVVLSLDSNNDYVKGTIYAKDAEVIKNCQISTRVQVVIDKYQDIIDAGNATIGTVDGGLTKEQIGAYATDAIMNWDYGTNPYGDIDISITNKGGVRAAINDGDITRGEVFEVFPFQNAIVIVNMKGSEIKSFLGSFGGSLYYEVKDGTYTSLSDNTYYQVAVIDYVFEDVDHKEFLAISESNYYYSGTVLRDIMIEYIDAIY